nr:ferrous iron transport protein B [Pseudenhygromyxa sp. WMMC2535]
MRVAVAGNPNVGKTSLFNLLTGSRYKVGNYPGITVETRDGALRMGSGRAITLTDLPGTYSLTPMAEDEALAFRALTGAEGPQPDAVLLVLDASNLARNLYLALQIRELGLPLVVALNMIDLARDAKLPVDVDALSAALGGAPVVPTVGRSGEGVEVLAALLGKLEPGEVAPHLIDAGDEQPALAACLETLAELPELAQQPARARWLLAAAAADNVELTDASEAERRVLAELDQGAPKAVLELVAMRYAEVDRLLAGMGPAPEGQHLEAPAMARSERIDKLLTHRVFGPLVFLLVMALVFQSIFSWADPFVGLIEGGVGSLGELVAGLLGPGLFTDLLTEGVIAGVGNVVVFVPQIALLFLFIGLLEDSGYMARAAFIVDRLMSRVGLNGKAFVPLLSGYACAIPAIMSTRTISSFKDRLVTILMIPFMSCSARLPVYALVIGALFTANRRVFGPFTEGGLILLGMYLLSTVSALGLGALYKRTLLASPTPPLVLELPPYRIPRLWDTLRHVWDRTMDFLRDAGTIILAVTIVLWGLLSFPQVDPSELEPGETAIERSYAGRVGKAIEPAIEPIGQDWRIGVGLIGSFAAREVLVSTLGLVYGIEGADEDDAPLREVIRDAKDPVTGKPRYSKLSGLALMVFFVYACQCMSTLAVVRRETRGWRWPLFMLVSMTVIAYVAALLVYQVGQLFVAG